MGDYLSRENLQELERISEFGRLKFGTFIAQMIKEEEGSEHVLDIFKKRPYLQIESLQHEQHIVRNKLSDKFNRRDVQFYDLYVKKDSGEELARLTDN